MGHFIAMEILGAVGSYLASALLAAGKGLVSLLAPSLLAMFLASVSSSFAERNLVRLMGPRGFLASIGWLGTAVHELAHAAMCLLFRHRITDICIFDPSMKTGALGYVEHEWDRNSTYQKMGNFFIGVAPLLLGTALLFVFAKLALGANQVPGTWKSTEWLVFQIAGHSAEVLTVNSQILSASDWKTWLFLYLALAVGASMNASRADLKGASHAMGFLVFAGVVLFLATHWAIDLNDVIDERIKAVHVQLLALLLLVSFLNVMAGFLSFVLARLIRGRSG